MCHLTTNANLLTETFDQWETVVCNGDLLGLELEVTHGFVSGDLERIQPKERCSVGRTQQADIVAPLDAKMSRSHFSIECGRDHGVVRDLGSTNGTYVNGRLARGETIVRDGDQITAGSSVFTVRFVTP